MKNTRFTIAAALAGVLALVGCTAATTSSTAATSGTTRAAAGNPASLPGLTYVTAYSINTDNPTLTSVVSGAIGDYGPAEEVSPGSTGVSAHGGELELKLARGTFRLNVADIDKKFIEGTSHEPVFPRTCSTYVSVSDAVPIVPGSGTGTYQGIAGTFAMTLTLNEVHNSPCTTSVSILRQVIVLSGAGKIAKR
jgi:hypothetical protein